MMADFWSDEREDQLIVLFEEQPCLYAVSLKAYSNKLAKNSAIRRIATNLGVDVQEVSRKLHSLRTQYNRYRKQPASGSAGGRTARQEFVLRRLAFLEPHIKKRQSTSTMEEKEDEIIDVGGEDEEEEEEVVGEEEKEEEEGLEDPQPAQFKWAQVQPEQHLLSTMQKYIKKCTEQPKDDDIKTFCMNLEQKMRRIRDENIRFELERQVEELCYQALMRDRARQACDPSTSYSGFQQYYGL